MCTCVYGRVPSWVLTWLLGVWEGRVGRCFGWMVRRWCFWKTLVKTKGSYDAAHGLLPGWAWWQEHGCGSGWVIIQLCCLPWCHSGEFGSAHGTPTVCLAWLRACDTEVKVPSLSLGSCHANEGKRKVYMHKCFIHRRLWACCLTFVNFRFLIHKMGLQCLL